MALKKAEPGTYPTTEYIIPTNRGKFGLTTEPDSWVSPSNVWLYKGSNLTNSLVGVLSRFGEDRIAVMADTESMFYQVTVPDHESSFPRFLWWENVDLAREPQEFQMVVHPFGAVSSPACANLRSVRKLKIISTAFLQTSLTLSKGVFMWTSV